MKLGEFKRAIKDGDFSIGDSFWIDDIEFEVKANNRTLLGRARNVGDKLKSKTKEDELKGGNEENGI